MRLFFGVPLPDDVRARVATLLSRLGRVDAAVRWIDPSSAHFTLKFLGEVSVAELRDVDAAARRAAAAGSPCRVRFRTLGSFPAAKRPRVIWVGVEAESTALTELHEELEAAMAASGFAPERRPFRPHVTLGRVKGGRGLAALRAAIADAASAADLGAMTIRDLTLFESHLSRHGPRYHTAGTYRLGA